MILQFGNMKIENLLIPRNARLMVSYIRESLLFGVILPSNHKKRKVLIRLCLSKESFIRSRIKQSNEKASVHVRQWFGFVDLIDVEIK